ncbi:MaoC family dehydratase N-terminal domain-containing protein [Myroides odoratimimus subsp. xuanwuensis]
MLGRTYPPTRPYAVSEEKVREFVAATGDEYDGGPAPATFPVVLAFEAMNAFLASERIDLSRIVHGEQRFAYRRPVVPGDVLTTSLTIASLRQIGGNDIIGTRSDITDAAGEVVCSTSATLVHRAPASQDQEAGA